MTDFQVTNMGGEKSIDVRYRNAAGELVHDILEPAQVGTYNVNHPSAFSVYEVPPVIESVEDKDAEIAKLRGEVVNLRAKVTAKGDANV